MVDKPNLEAFQALVELDKKERSLKFQQNYFSAYVLSAILAPIGIYYFIKFCFFSDGTREDIKAGITSLAITIISFFQRINHSGKSKEAKGFVSVTLNNFLPEN